MLLLEALGLFNYLGVRGISSFHKNQNFLKGPVGHHCRNTPTSAQAKPYLIAFYNALDHCMI